MNTMQSLPWLAEAAKYNGMKEIKGSKHNPNIVSWLKNLKAWWLDDENPWCGTFVAHCLSSSERYIVKHWYRALAWREAGMKLKEPAYGCLGVITRKGGGHVCFIVGRTKDGYLVGYGGNQNDAVNYAKFHPSRFVDFVWPADAKGVHRIPLQTRYDLPVFDDRSLTVANTLA